MGVKTERVQAHTTKGENANNGEVNKLIMQTKTFQKDVREAGKTSKSVQTQISAWSDPRVSFGVLTEY